MLGKIARSEAGEAKLNEAGKAALVKIHAGTGTW